MATNIKKYNAAILTLLLGGLFSVLLLNAVVDPLWFFGGNKVSGKNFSFNERIAKSNQFYKTFASYDCVIIGSSRATLLDASLITGYNCFNFAFSGGQPKEYLEFSKWAVKLNFQPKLVILAIDDRDFKWIENPLTIPEFIKKGSPPEPFFKSYLSLGALSMSLNTLLDRSPLPRYYDTSFKCVIADDAPAYKPSEVLEKKQWKKKENVVAIYNELLSLYPAAEVIAYITPVSIWKLKEKTDAELLTIIDASLALSQTISPLFDFSIPSELTMNKGNTYDGHHYNKQVNIEIANRLNGQSAEFGVLVNELDKQSYRHYYTNLLN